MTSYTVSTTNVDEFEDIVNADGSTKVFAANINDYGSVENCIDFVQARKVQLSPKSWFGGIALKWEIYTAPDAGTCLRA